MSKSRSGFDLFSDFTKMGIVVFVFLCGIAGYATGIPIGKSIDWSHFLHFLVGLYLLSSGSLGLNQVQEYKLDQKMNRTAGRPVASGKLTPAAGGILAFALIVAGSSELFRTSFLTGMLGLITVFLYNGVYTYWWKPVWVFGAVPGALPGALPITMGYSANNPNIFTNESIYLFLVLFLWQMPHFWALALRYRRDYAMGGIPTLPVALGVEKTLFHIGMYTILYVGVVFAAPWFLRSSWIFVVLVLPLGVKILVEFWRLFRSNGEQRWLHFFLWTNTSVIVFLFVPVVERWKGALFSAF